MVELWRNDSWANPLYGGEELQLLRTDTDVSELMVDSASMNFLPTSCAVQALRAPALKSGTPFVRAGLKAVLQAAAHRAVTADATCASQPVLRGAACRTDADRNSAVPLASAMRLSCKRKLSDTGVSATDLAAEGLSGFPGSELPALSWEDAELPVETAWMFDASSEPVPSVLNDLYPECEDDDEPDSPTLVFTDKAACPSDSSTSASASASNCTEAEVQGGKTMENDTNSSDDGPASSADTATTRLRSSAVDAPTDTTADSAAVTNSVAKPDLSAGNDEKALSEVDSQDLTCRSTKKPRRAAANRSSTRPGAAKATAPVPPSKAPAAAAAKKQKGRQCCVQCFTFSTPQWREGPQGARTLCNACGVRYRKQLNQAKKLKGK